MAATCKGQLYSLLCTRMISSYASVRTRTEEISDRSMVYWRQCVIYPVIQRHSVIAPNQQRCTNQAAGDHLAARIRSQFVRVTGS